MKRLRLSVWHSLAGSVATALLLEAFAWEGAFRIERVLLGAVGILIVAVVIDALDIPPSRRHDDRFDNRRL